MSEPAISVQNVCKKFHRGMHVDSLFDLLAVWTARRARRRKASEFLAVRDMSFQVARGEAFGVIGPNGAGKSTLLKLLAGILRPNSGSISVHGRVSALIELGAGFHGDLTGRENIFLNACIMGMSRRTARHRFDAIVEFAGIREFLDTPVKRYSSGMQARLGFAIAAHAEPRVLLVDEVLSVGDRVFRARCMDRMKQFLRDGVGVVFVSHDLGAVNAFCDRVLLMNRGAAAYCGPAASAIAHYYDSCVEATDVTSAASPSVSISDVRLSDETGRSLSVYQSGQTVRMAFDVRFDAPMRGPSFGLSLVRTEDHLTLFESSSSRLGFEAPPAAAGDRRHVCFTFNLNVPPGSY
ncbi:MAG: ABC transporter ATP-binding protein, partial [Phycisphaerae bacterium]